MKKITFVLIAFLVGFSSLAQTLEIKVNGKPIDDFLASTSPVNTLPTNVPLDIEATYTNLPVAPGNTQPVGDQARIVIRFYEPASSPAVFKNADYKNGFTESSATSITETYQYTPTVDVSGYTLQIFAAGASSTQIEKYNISVDAAATLANKDFSVQEKKIEVYPNPTTDFINISDVSNIKILSVINLLGKTVKTFKAKNILDISGLNKGIYFLVGDNGFAKKIVKN
ncbi:T9SS type A sorting domain-containing protein [Polaribacter staleyi]|uniref:T9SS type A sorting domain-containing protein n=1 Tax=Polaribacter staleyi TaxID=2022337 RepID=UPI0031BB24F0